MLTNEEKRLIEVVEQAPQTTPYSWTVQTIKALIKNEVEKYVISKCSEELESGELLIVNVEIGEMPKEAVKNILDGLKERFNEAGISKVIFTATRNGEGIITTKKIKEIKK